MTTIERREKTPDDLIRLMRDLVDVLVEDFPYAGLSQRDLENRNAAIVAMEKCLREAADEASAMALASDLITQGWAGAIVDRFDNGAS